MQVSKMPSVDAVPQMSHWGSKTTAMRRLCSMNRKRIYVEEAVTRIKVAGAVSSTTNGSTPGAALHTVKSLFLAALFLATGVEAVVVPTSIGAWQGRDAADAKVYPSANASADNSQTKLSPLCSRFYHYSTQDERRQMTDRIVNEAREIAGLSTLKPGLGAANLEKFFNLHHGHMNCDGATYRRVWKGGNDFIRFNMFKRCNLWTESWTVPESSNFTFSFVRDPLSHFVSGYREATSRTFFDCCDVAADGNVTDHDKSEAANAATCKYSCEDFVGVEGTTRLAKTYLRDLLDGRLLNENRHFWHVALMAANLYGGGYSQLEFVGSLENIEADWARMCEEHECPPHLQSYQDLDMHMGQHRSSADAFGQGAGLARAFTEQPQLAAAVRRLISLDEDCFHDVLGRGRGARRRRQFGEVELPAWLDA